MTVVSVRLILSQPEHTHQSESAKRCTNRRSSGAFVAPVYRSIRWPGAGESAAVSESGTKTSTAGADRKPNRSARADSLLGSSAKTAVDLNCSDSERNIGGVVFLSVYKTTLGNALDDRKSAKPSVFPSALEQRGAQHGAIPSLIRRELDESCPSICETMPSADRGPW